MKSKGYLLSIMLLVVALGVGACGTPDGEADKDQDVLAKQAAVASSYLEKTDSLASEVANLPRTMNKPAKTIAQARELKSQARELQQTHRSSASVPPSLQQIYDDLASANRDLARSASKLEAVAVDVKDGNRDPALGGARKSLRGAERLIASSYTELSAFVTSEVGGSVDVKEPGDVKLAKAKLPPLPDLIFNLDSFHTARVGKWQPSSENSEFSEAVAVYGPPDVYCREQPNVRGSAGFNEWNSLGLRVMQADLGIGDPCEGQVQSVEVSGPAAKQWVTEAGLRVGDPESRIFELYPDATDRGGMAVDGQTEIVLLSFDKGIPSDFTALVEGGTVAGLRIPIGGAGE